MRLSELMNRARRARKINMNAIRDYGGQKIEPTMWRDQEDFLRYAIRLARDFRLDRQEGQRTRLIVMCEASGTARSLPMPSMTTASPSYPAEVSIPSPRTTTSHGR